MSVDRKDVTSAVGMGSVGTNVTSPAGDRRREEENKMTTEEDVPRNNAEFTRGRPFAKGNSGRPRGSKNRAKRPQARVRNHPHERDAPLRGQLRRFVALRRRYLPYRCAPWCVASGIRGGVAARGVPARPI